VLLLQSYAALVQALARATRSVTCPDTGSTIFGMRSAFYGNNLIDAEDAAVKFSKRAVPGLSYIGYVIWKRMQRKNMLH
jgi:hypothetical protein